MPVDRAALRAFFTGGSSGYPKTLYSEVEKWRRALLAECRDRRVFCALVGTTEPAQHGPTDTALLDVSAQTSERWPDPDRADGRMWTLPQSIAQIGLCCRALDAADKTSSAGEPAPTLKPSPMPAQSSSWPPAGAAWSPSWDGSDPRDGGKFDNAPWNWQSFTPVVKSGRLRIEFLPNGAQAPAKGAEKGSGSRRCEMQPTLPAAVRPQVGRTVWHRLDVALVSFPVQTTAWSVLAQWKQDGTGSPPLALAVHGGRWVLEVHDPGGKQIATHDAGKAEQGRATTLAIGVTYGTTASSGRVVVHQDGVKTCDVGMPTMHPGKGSYVKTGLYASAALSGPLCVEFDRMAVGPTLASVT